MKEKPGESDSTASPRVNPIVWSDGPAIPGEKLPELPDPYTVDKRENVGLGSIRLGGISDLIGCEPAVSEPQTNKAFRNAGSEVTSFLDNTIKSCLKWGAERFVDLIAPGVGAMIGACEKILTIVKGIKAAATGKGKIGIPLASFGGFEFMIDVHVGNDPEGRDLPVSAYITPGGGSVLGQIEVTPESDHRRATVIRADLSRRLQAAGASPPRWRDPLSYGAASPASALRGLRR